MYGSSGVQRKIYVYFFQTVFTTWLLTQFDNSIDDAQTHNLLVAV